MDSLHRLSPFLSRLRGRLGWHNDLSHGAARSWIIEPEGQLRAQPALYHEQDLERVCGVVHEWHSIEDEIDKIRGGPGVHAPTIAYELRGATLSGGAISTAKVMYPIRAARGPLLARRARKHLREGVLASTPFGLKWFGHWMFDDLPLLLAAADLGRPISALTSPSPHQKDYLERIGITHESGDDVFFDRLIVLQDFGQNAFKQRRHAEIRRRILHGARSQADGAPVMLLRGESGERRLLANEPAVAAALERRGFRILDPMRLQVAELVEACAEASLVVGVEGSQLTHGVVAMRRGGTLITLQPPARFSSIWFGICEGLDVRYGFVVGHGQDNGFTIDVDGLERLLDRVQSSEH